MAKCNLPPSDNNKQKQHHIRMNVNVQYKETIQFWGSGSLDNFHNLQIRTEDLFNKVQIYCFIKFGIHITTEITKHDFTARTRRFCCTCPTCRRAGTKETYDKVLGKKIKKWTIAFARSSPSHWILSTISPVCCPYVHNSFHEIRWETNSAKLIANHPAFQQYVENLHSTHGDKPNATNPKLLKSFQEQHPSIIFQSKQGSTKTTNNKLKNINALFAKAKAIVEKYLKKLKLDIAETQYKSLPAYLDELCRENKSVTTALQCDSENRFYRFFIAFPIASPSYFGILTKPVFVVDCTHSNCLEYDGVIFNICSKDVNGSIIPLAFAVIPNEATEHLSWCIGMCWKHGMPLEKHAIFSDQGPLLAAFSSIRHEWGIQFFLQICQEHFLRNIRDNYGCLFPKEPKITKKTNFKKKAKKKENKFGTMSDFFLRNFMSLMSDSVSAAEFFNHLDQMMRALVCVHKSSDKNLRKTFEFLEYILEHHPKTWTIFANTESFNNSEFHARATKLRNTFVLGMEIADLVDNTEPEESDFESIIHESCSYTKLRKPIWGYTDMSDKPCSLFGEKRTNISESLAGSLKSNGTRSASPPDAIKALILCYNDAINESLNKLRQSIELNSEHTDAGNDLKLMISKENANFNHNQVHRDVQHETKYSESEQNTQHSTTIVLNHNFTQYGSAVHRCTLRWNEESAGNPRIYEFWCDNPDHMVFTSMYQSYCPCVSHVLEEARSHDEHPIEAEMDTLSLKLFPKYGLVSECVKACDRGNFDIRRKNLSQNPLIIHVPSDIHATNHHYGSSEGVVKPPPKYKKGTDGKGKRKRSRGEDNYTPSKHGRPGSVRKGPQHKGLKTPCSDKRRKVVNEIIDRTSDKNQFISKGGIDEIESLQRPQKRQHVGDQLLQRIPVVPTCDLVEGSYMQYCVSKPDANYAPAILDPTVTNNGRKINEYDVESRPLTLQCLSSQKVKPDYSGNDMGFIKNTPYKSDYNGVCSISNHCVETSIYIAEKCLPPKSLLLFQAMMLPRLFTAYNDDQSEIGDCTTSDTVDDLNVNVDFGTQDTFLNLDQSTIFGTQESYLENIGTQETTLSSTGLQLSQFSSIYQEDNNEDDISDAKKFTTLGETINSNDPFLKEYGTIYLSIIDEIGSDAYLKSIFAQLRIYLPTPELTVSQKFFFSDGNQPLAKEENGFAIVNQLLGPYLRDNREKVQPSKFLYKLHDLMWYESNKIPVSDWDLLLIPYRENVSANCYKYGLLRIYPSEGKCYMSNTLGEVESCIREHIDPIIRNHNLELEIIGTTVINAAGTYYHTLAEMMAVVLSYTMTHPSNSKPDLSDQKNLTSSILDSMPHFLNASALVGRVEYSFFDKQINTPVEEEKHASKSPKRNPNNRQYEEEDNRTVLERLNCTDTNTDSRSFTSNELRAYLYAYELRYLANDSKEKLLKRARMFNHSSYKSCIVEQIYDKCSVTEKNIKRKCIADAEGITPKVRETIVHFGTKEYKRNGDKLKDYSKQTLICKAGTECMHADRRLSVEEAHNQCKLCSERVHVLCEFNCNEGMCVSCVEIIKTPFTSDPITKFPLTSEPERPKSELDPEQQQEPGLESNSICVDKDDGDDSSSSGDGGYLSPSDSDDSEKTRRRKREIRERKVGILNVGDKISFHGTMFAFGSRERLRGTIYKITPGSDYPLLIVTEGSDGSFPMFQESPRLDTIIWLSDAKNGHKLNRFELVEGELLLSSFKTGTLSQRDLLQSARREIKENGEAMYSRHMEEIARQSEVSSERRVIHPSDSAISNRTPNQKIDGVLKQNIDGVIDVVAEGMPHCGLKGKSLVSVTPDIRGSALKANNAKNDHKIREVKKVMMDVACASKKDLKANNAKHDHESCPTSICDSKIDGVIDVVAEGMRCGLKGKSLASVTPDIRGSALKANNAKNDHKLREVKKVMDVACASKKDLKANNAKHDHESCPTSTCDSDSEASYSYLYHSALSSKSKSTSETQNTVHPNNRQRDPFIGKKETDVLFHYPFPRPTIRVSQLIEEAALGIPPFLGKVQTQAGPQSYRRNNTNNHVDHVVITVADYRRIPDGTPIYESNKTMWFNDELVGFFMFWISRHINCRHSSNVYFLKSHLFTKLEENENVSSWTKVDIFQKKMIFIPIQKFDHWSLIVVVNPGSIVHDVDEEEDKDRLLPCILHLDPICGQHDSRNFHRTIVSWLNREWQKENNTTPFTTKGCKLVVPKVPKQKGFNDCGVLVCQYAFAMLQLRDVEFTRQDAEQKFKNLITESPKFEIHNLHTRFFRKDMATLFLKLSRIWNNHHVNARRSSRRRKTPKRSVVY